MQSPSVLKAIYTMEHAQCVDRMAQTLLQLGVPSYEVDALVRRGEGLPHGVGNHWIPIAQRIAHERSIRGIPAVSSNLLKESAVMGVRRNTVRISVQSERLRLVAFQDQPAFGSHSASSPAAPPSDKAAPARAPFPAKPAPQAAPEPGSSVLCMDLQHASELLAEYPLIEKILPGPQVDALQCMLRSFVIAAEQVVREAARPAQGPITFRPRAKTASS